jgi:hypothetical protein
MARKKQAAEQPVKHELSTRISDSTTTVWVECSCGFETSFYTIVGDGVEAMQSARDEAERHVESPPPSEELVTEADESPSA